MFSRAFQGAGPAPGAGALSAMTVDAVCERLKQIEGLEPSMLPQYCATIRKVSRPCLPGETRSSELCSPRPAAAAHAGMGRVGGTHRLAGGGMDRTRGRPLPGPGRGGSLSGGAGHALGLGGTAPARPWAVGAVCAPFTSLRRPQANINGRVLAQCNIEELKKEMNMNFGDWHLFRSAVRLVLRRRAEGRRG